MWRFEIPDHPDVACAERTGYPPEEESDDLWGYDSYDERRELELFGEF